MTAYHPFNTPSGSYGTAVARAKSKVDPAPVVPSTVVGDPEREARIDSLRERYRSGTYYVNANSLAARIVDEHIEG